MIKRFLYRLKAEICMYFEWFNKEYDPETDRVFVFEENSGVSWDSEVAGTVYWYEQYVVGTGLFNWWYSFIWDTSA